MKSYKMEMLYIDDEIRELRNKITGILSEAKTEDFNERIISIDKSICYAQMISALENLRMKYRWKQFRIEIKSNIDMIVLKIRNKIEQ